MDQGLSLAFDPRADAAVRHEVRKLGRRQQGHFPPVQVAVVSLRLEDVVLEVADGRAVRRIEDRVNGPDART